MQTGNAKWRPFNFVFNFSLFYLIFLSVDICMYSPNNLAFVTNLNLPPFSVLSSNVEFVAVIFSCLIRG